MAGFNNDQGLRLVSGLCLSLLAQPAILLQLSNQYIIVQVLSYRFGVIIPHVYPATRAAGPKLTSNKQNQIELHHRKWDLFKGH